MKNNSVLLCLSFGLGLLMPFGFAPYNIWLLPSIVLCIFLSVFYLTNSYNRKYFSFFYGLSFGLGFFSHGIWWISISLSQFGGAPLIFAAFATFLVILAMALYYAVFMHILYQCTKISFLFSLTVAAPLWMFFEWLRSFLLTGFPWLALGYSLVDSPFKMIVLPQMGALLGSFWVIWLALICVPLLLKINQKIIPNKFKISPASLSPNITFKAFFLLNFPALIVAGTMILLYLQSDEIIEQKPLKVAIVQGNIPISLKFAEDKFWDNTKSYINLSEQILEQEQDKIDLLVWPETAVATFYDSAPELFDHFRTWAQDLNMHLLTGLATGSLAQGDYRNSIIHIGNKTDAFYEKHRLLPFGEYLPMRWFFSFFRNFVEIPLDDFTAGASIQAPFEVKDAKVATSICFEGVFGNDIHHQASQAGILVNISNDAWFGNSLAPFQHFQIIKARAIELARPMIRATNTGISAFIDAHGNVSNQAPMFEKSALAQIVIPNSGLSVYAKWGDSIWLYLCSIILLILLTLTKLNRKLFY